MEFPPLTVCPSNSGPTEAQLLGERTKTQGPQIHTLPAADAQLGCPSANRRGGCRERGGRRSPGAMRIRWSRAPRRRQRSQGGRGDRSSPAVANTSARASTLGPTRPRAPRPRAGRLGRLARQRRNPNLAAPQFRRWECSRARRPDGETLGCLALSLARTPARAKNPNTLPATPTKSPDPAGTKDQELGGRTLPLQVCTGQDLGRLQVWGG